MLSQEQGVIRGLGITDRYGGIEGEAERTAAVLPAGLKRARVEI
jgi:hypothetical protein